jgi:adenosine deaminase/aminodeoxyfutalosine deaminase
MGDFFRELPKAELHLHLEGSLEPETLQEIDPRLSLDEVRERYRYDSFQGFIESYIWVLGYLRGPDEYALATRHLLERLVAENVRYAEINLSAGTMLWQKKAFAPIYDAVRREAGRSPVEVWWILDAVRQFGKEHGQEVAELAVERSGEGVVAFGIGGDELKGPAEEFSQAFRFVKDLGLHVVVHAGETAGPASIWAALEAGADRIGHGVTAAEDPKLLSHLREHDIPVEVCLSSNLATGAIRAMADHPLRAFREAGVPVVLNTDDPAMFHTTLAAEYELAAREFGLTDAELRDLAKSSFRYAFAAR